MQKMAKIGLLYSGLYFSWRRKEDIHSNLLSQNFKSAHAGVKRFG